MTKQTDTQPLRTPTFMPAKRVRSFEDIMLQIKQAVLSGQLTKGERLPSERELSRDFGVSRSTLREALRALEAGGVVKIKPGARGGIFVCEPDEEQIGSAIDAVLQFRKATVRDLAEFRVTFEAETAAWAAERADPGDDDALQAIVEEFAKAVEAEVQWPVLAEIDVRFHEAVARASKNQVRVAIMLGVHRALYRASVSLSHVATNDVRRSIALELAGVHAAIRAHDVPAAQRRMKTHVRKFSELELLVEEREAGDPAE